MTKREALSAEHMAAVLDNAPVAVYVSAVDDYKLLYVNRLARQFFGAVFGEIEDMDVACYSAAGFKDICPFCQMEKMSESELLIREYYHPSNDRVYQLSGKLIDWAGKRAHIEYVVDITEKKQEEELHKKAEAELNTTFSSIPCGLCVYKFENEKIIPLFHNEAFYKITGYSGENISHVERETDYLGVHPEDLKQLQYKIQSAIQSIGAISHTYRLWNDTAGEYRYMHLDGTVRIHEDGRKLLYGVYSDVSEQKQLEKALVAANDKLHNIINAIPGGIACYRVESSRFIPTFFTDGVSCISGHTREEYEKMIQYNVLDIIYELDRQRVMSAVQSAYISGEILDISYRMRHKNGSLIWIHLNGLRIGELSKDAMFYAVFTGMSAETRLFQSIANETADGIYVIDQRNYELLYASGGDGIFNDNQNVYGEKCYAALYGRSKPCEFCTIENGYQEEEEFEIEIEETGCFYSTRFRRTDWNGIPAYVKYMRDITEEVRIRREKERLEMYFKTIVDMLPGGVSVLCMEPDGVITPEYISDGFASMTKMTVSEATRLYERNILAGVHPDDITSIQKRLERYIEEGADYGELIGRMMCGDGGYVWVKNNLSIRRMSDGVLRLYCAYTDITGDIEEKTQLRVQYEEMILQHYRMPGPGTLIIGHCNITKNRILNIRDYTDSKLLERFGTVREKFFSGIASFIVDEKDRNEFLHKYLNAPSLAAYAEKKTEQILDCYIELPEKNRGSYVRFKVNMVETPDTGDITGILTVTDITDKTIADRMLHQLSVNSHDYIADLDIERDSYVILTYNENADCLPPLTGCHSELVYNMSNTMVVPQSREEYSKALELHEIGHRLNAEGAYTIAYSLMDENGDIREKNMTVFSNDLRLGRVCLVCTDVTDMLATERKSQKALEKALDEAKKANMAKSEFLSSMSHDIRTPMNAIMGMTALAEMHFDDPVRVKECLQKISVASRHLLSLINDVLDMSKIEQSQITINLIQIYLPELIENISAIIAPQAQEAELKFDIRADNIRHNYFYGDFLRINQILINLLSNAVKFTPKGGMVSFGIEEIPAAENKEKIRYRFSVCDTGIGMTEEFLRHIYDPFVRDRGVVRIEGTGLGLSITRSLVDLMQGEIYIDSKVNQGTVFQVEIEFEPVSDQAIIKDRRYPEKFIKDKEMLSECCFLVAEDNKINSEILCEVLSIYGAECVVKTDGRQALEAFQAVDAGTFDAILMDIQMPVMNGYEAARAIRSLNRPDAATIPIIAMTANAFAEDVQEALQAGMNAHIAKPIDIALLQQTLGRILDRQP